MQRKCRYYKVENINTGEVFSGNIKVIKNNTGIKTRDLYIAAYRGSVIGETWKVEFSDELDYVENCNGLTKEVCEEWDKFITSIHKKPKSKFRKPQEII